MSLRRRQDRESECLTLADLHFREFIELTIWPFFTRRTANFTRGFSNLWLAGWIPRLAKVTISLPLKIPNNHKNFTGSKMKVFPAWYTFLKYAFLAFNSSKCYEKKNSLIENLVLIFVLKARVLLQSSIFRWQKHVSFLYKIQFAK